MITYSGTWSQSTYQEHLEKLQAGVARYDPPWTPWFLRTNEILVELESAPAPAP